MKPHELYSGMMLCVSFPVTAPVHIAAQHFGCAMLRYAMRLYRWYGPRSDDACHACRAKKYLATSIGSLPFVNSTFWMSKPDCFFMWLMSCLSILAALCFVSYSSLVGKWTNRPMISRRPWVAGSRINRTMAMMLHFSKV